MGKQNDKLWGAIRQFRHNTDNSPSIMNPEPVFVIAYDMAVVDALVADLEASNEKLAAEVTNWKISMGTAIEERDETNAELEAENARLTGISESKIRYTTEMMKKKSAIKEALILAWSEAFWRADVSNNEKYDVRCRAELRYLVEFGE